MTDNCKELEAILDVAPLLNQFLIDDVGVLVTDREKVLAYYPGQKMDFGIEAGQTINSKWVVNKALRQEERVVEEKDASITGVPYIGVATPLYDSEGSLIGGLTIAQVTDKKEQLIEMANNLSQATETVNQNIEEINDKSLELTETKDSLNEIANETKERVKNTDDIVEIIKKISRKTKLIGFNASIEAARVGKEGEGFGVVAEEIQNLASQSSDSILEAEEILAEVNTTISKLDDVADKIDEISDEKLNLINDIYAQVQNLNSLGNQVLTMAEGLSKESI